MTPRMASTLFVAVAIAAGLGYAGPGAHAAHPEVTIKSAGGAFPGCEEDDTCYDPSHATVDVNGKVIMQNTEPEDAFTIHSFTSGTFGDGVKPGEGDFHFELRPGESAEWSPTEVGEYPYYCAYHGWMTGSITVQEAGAAHDDEQMDSMENTEMSDTPEDDGNQIMEALEEDESMEGMEMEGTEEMEPGEMMMAGSGMLVVEVDDHNADEAVAGDIIPIDLTVTMMGEDGNEEDVEHFNYELVVMQSGQTIIEPTEGHSHDGRITVDVPLAAAPSDDAPVEVMLTSMGFGLPSDGELTGYKGELPTTTIVPEFGAVAVMVLAAAVVSVVVLTSRTGLLVPRI